MEELLNQLVEERAKVWHQGKEVLDRIHNAKKEDQDPSGEDEQTWTRVNDELSKLDERIAQLNERVKGDKIADEARANAERFIRPPEDPKPEAADPLRAWAIGEGPKSFDVSLKGLRAEHELRGTRLVPAVKDELSVGTGSEGGDTVPTSFRRQLYEHLIENTAVRQTNTTVLTTGSGEALLIPKTLTHTSGSIVGEGATILTDDPTFGQATLDAFKYGRLIQVSSELVQDTAVDLVGYLARSFGQALANASGAHYVTGTGSSQPRGVITAGSVGVTGGTGQSGVPTADELIDLYFSVIAAHRNRGWWLMADATVASVRKLKDDNGQYLWQPGLAGSTPNTILDRPYVTDPNVPATSTDATSVAFGDFSTYYIRDVAGVRFERSDEFAFNRDVVTYRALLRSDGEQVDETGAIKTYVGGTA